MSLALVWPAPVIAQYGEGCCAVDGMQERPVAAQSACVFDDAARRGRHAEVRDVADGDSVEGLAPFPVTTICMAGCEGPDLGSGNFSAEHCDLLRASSNACGGSG